MENNLKPLQVILESYGREFYDKIKHVVKDVGFGGALVYGLLTPDSDLDVMLDVSSLDELDAILNASKIEHFYSKKEQQNEQFGDRNYISIWNGKFKNRKVELHAEQAPILRQTLPVHSVFLKKKFDEDNELYLRIKYLKQKGENREAGGYRKAHILVFEKQMKEDLGFVPERQETSEYGLKYPVWQGKLSPFEWIFIREVYGVDKGKEMIKDLL